MKHWIAAVAMGVLLVGCAEKDQPNADQVADAIKGTFDSAYPPGLGQRMELQKWDKLTFDCEKVEGDLKIMRCETGGLITIAGYQGGVQTDAGPQEVEPEWIYTFEKRGEGEWVATKVERKGAS